MQQAGQHRAAHEIGRRMDLDRQRTGQRHGPNGVHEARALALMLGSGEQQAHQRVQAQHAGAGAQHRRAGLQQRGQGIVAGQQVLQRLRDQPRVHAVRHVQRHLARLQQRGAHQLAVQARRFAQLGGMQALAGLRRCEHGGVVATGVGQGQLREGVGLEEGSAGCGVQGWARARRGCRCFRRGRGCPAAPIEMPDRTPGTPSRNARCHQRWARACAHSGTRAEPR
jgi:hypothetical protein